jgi:signal transduction histidine kinase
MLITDFNYMSRIMDNLISNAIKYTYSGKNIYVNLSESQHDVHISIRDEGQGISEEEQDKMFQSFQNLSSTPTGGENSTGLGLSIVYQLTQNLGGEIRVNSKLGVGTEILLKFGKNVHKKTEQMKKQVSG